MKISKLLLIGAITTSSILAHGLWLNTFESINEKGGHVIVGFGTGHSLTIHDAISRDPSLKSFDLITPKNEKIALELPLSKIKDIYDDKVIKVSPSNLAMQKITFNKDSLSGTYSAAFSTKALLLTKYIDQKGNQRFKRAAASKVKDAKEIISSMKKITYGKSYFVFKKFTKVESIGHDLELIPKSDISKLYIGDTIEFEVLYKGKALEKGYVTAKNSLSKSDNSLFSSIRKGKVKFILTNVGQWSFDISKEVQEKDITLSYTATATLNIK